MAIRILTAVSAIAIALSGCAGYQPTYSPPAATQVASRVPVYTPPPAPPQPVTRPVRAASIEYVQGQPMVRISVPGVASFRCILDTGASDLIFPGWWLVEMHDKYGLLDSDWRVLGVGSAQLANGSQTQTYRLMFREIHIGPWRLSNVPVGVTVGAGDCLLGMSVLKAFGHPMIDFANQRLILED